MRLAYTRVGYQSVLVQLLGGAQDVQGGAHGPAGDVPVVDGQDGVAGVPHVVDQGLTGGAEHLRDAAGRPVQKFKGFLTIHCHSSFPANDQPYSNRTPGKKQDDLQMERELVYWEKKGGIVTCQCQPRRPGGRPWPRRWRRLWGR